MKINIKYLYNNDRRKTYKYRIGFFFTLGIIPDRVSTPP